VQPPKALNDKVLDRNILVVGTARDCSTSLEQTVSVIRKALIDFKRISFFIVESDSVDDTIEILSRLAETDDNFQYISLGSLSQKIASRAQRIAFCRNEYLKFVAKSKKNFDYILVTDLDGVSLKISRQAVLSCWTRDDWDACFSNQEAPYYDIWALRHPKWSPTNCWEEYENLVAQGTRPYWAKRSAVYSKMIRIDKQSKWIEVDSAFGGLGIYKATVIEGNWYSGTDEFGFEQSEHVLFHDDIKSKGGHLFINPALINGSWNEHNRELRKTRQILNYGKHLLSLLLK
jgi:hypothetical protein